MRRYQAPPFWRHPNLKRLVEPDTMDGADAVIDSIADERGDEDDEDEEGNVIETYQHEGGCSRVCFGKEKRMNSTTHV
jgi:hypothetical protein